MEKSVKHNYFVKNIEEIEICGEKGYFLKVDEYKEPYEIVKLKYKNHNLENCDGCKTGYEKTINIFQEKFKSFPNCCEEHKKLTNESWFDIRGFREIPKLYSNKLYYSWHHILNFIEDENWEVEIIDFLEHVLKSFGSFPIGYGEPLYLSSYIDDLTRIVNTIEDNKERKDVIINYLRNYGKPKNVKKNTDLNILIGIYSKWYKTFPFELSYFNHLKTQFSKNLPLFENPRNNKYTGLTTFTAISKAQLFNYLITITNKILLEINTETLIDKGLVLDLSNTKLELIRQQRKQKIKKGYVSQSRDEGIRYRKMLKEWLKDEINFIDKIKPLITKVSILNDLLQACYTMQQNNLFYNANEDRRTKQILDLLSNKYEIKDQSTYGVSTTGKSAGSVDGVIKSNSIEYFIEALNLTSLNRPYIKLHLDKLEEKYDSKGLREKFVIVYYNVEEGIFEQESNKYKVYLDEEHKFIYSKLNSLEELDTKYVNSKLFKSIHKREGDNVLIYHILLKFPKKLYL